MTLSPGSIPTRIGRYEIRGELGRGMMGVVYEAHDPSLHRNVALKVVRMVFAVTDAEKETFEKRFLSEARIAARLSHPGIVVVHDVGRDPETGILYLALERLNGRTLAEMSADGARVPWRTSLEIVARVADALHYAHGQGVIHRDIKPANIMVLGASEARIMDFGLAKIEAGAELTAAGQSVGTPLFMSPEQVQGRKLDGRTDLFSLGSVLYTLLTGARPFAADNVSRIMNRVAHQQPAPATDLVPELPKAVDYLLARAMAKDPADRYPDGRTLAEDIADVLKGREPRHRPGWTPPPPAEGTLASTASAPERTRTDLDLQPVVEPRAPAAPPRGGSRPVRLLALGMLLAGLTAYYVSVRSGDPLAEALAPLFALPSQPPTNPPVVPTPFPVAVAPSPESSPSESPPAAAASATAAPDVAPVGEPSSPPPESPSPPSPSPSPGKSVPALLSVRMEHHLKSGTLKVFLDGQLVAQAALRKGVVVEETSKVAPGRHDVRVQVKWDDNAKARRIAGTFRAGVTRRLEIGISRPGGDLSLDWK